jgi:hypothetical protein
MNQETKLKPVEFTYTIPLEKAEGDGMFLLGIASGPGVDTQKHEIMPQALESMARQINENPIPLTDWHRSDSIAIELGEVRKAFLNNDAYLGVEIELDEDNPSAHLLFRKVNKGKQYGLSIQGMATDVRNVYEEGKGIVRKVYDITLSAIGVTTRPIWTPSLGTVISKAIDTAQEAESVAEGDNASIMEKEVTPSEVAVETAVVQTDSAQPADTAETQESTKTQESVTVSSAPENETETKIVESTETTASTADVADVNVDSLMARLSEYIDNKITEAMNAFASLSQSAAPAAAQEVAVEKAESSQLNAEEFWTRLDKVFEERTAPLYAELETVKDRMPSVVEPAVLLRKSEGEEAQETLEALRKVDPRAFLRAGLAAMTGEQDKL